jgi:hypothetical protein
MSGRKHFCPGSSEDQSRYIIQERDEHCSLRLVGIERHCDF